MRESVREVWGRGVLRCVEVWGRGSVERVCVVGTGAEVVCKFVAWEAGGKLPLAMGFLRSCIFYGL